MRSIHALIAVSLLLITVPVISDGSDAAFPVLKLAAVYPTEGFEGFALTNYGTTTDIKGYSVTDGEGTVSFTSSITISKYETVYFSKSEIPGWFEAGRTIVYGQDGVTMKGFALSDNGDDVYLMNGEEMLDAFVYGDAKAKLGGWNGDAFQKITKKHVAVRTSLVDTNSSADWTMTIPGRSDFRNDTAYDAKVAPISFPDDQAPFFRTLQEAISRIDISVYLISHPRVVSSLLESLDEGVNVRILIEGSPAGGSTTSEIKALKTLTNAGAEVKVMRPTDGYRAYSYTHAKYAVIDDEKVIITSENWQQTSFDSNRGWGAVIVSCGYAQYMRTVFESDFFRSYDVASFSDVFPTAQGAPYSRYEPDVSEIAYYGAKVRPVLSPDNSYDTMRSFILSAGDRVYSQQLDVDYDWLNGNDNPVSWMRTVSSHTDCRLLVDVTFDDRNDSDIRDGYGIIDSLYGTKIKASAPTFSGLSHNKGVIVDDKVWIGSVNWTYNSFNDNREAAVIIDSHVVAEYYAALFLKDFGTQTVQKKEPTVDVQNKGQTFMLTADCDGGCLCTWDTDGDGIFETEGNRIVKEFPAGHHVVKVSIDDGEGVKVISLELTSEASEADNRIPLKYYPIIIICGAVLCYNAIRWARKRNDPDKGLQRRRF